MNSNERTNAETAGSRQFLPQKAPEGLSAGTLRTSAADVHSVRGAPDRYFFTRGTGALVSASRGGVALRASSSA